MELVGAIDLNLPLDFPTEGTPLDPLRPSIVVKIPDLQQFFLSPAGSNVEITLPDFAAAFGDVFDDLQYLSSFATSWEGFFAIVEELADGEVFGLPVPLIGDELATGCSSLSICGTA